MTLATCIRVGDSKYLQIKVRDEPAEDVTMR
jgi:hypothetical protein